MRPFVLVVVILIISNGPLFANDEKEIKHALLKYNYGIIKMAKSGETDFFKSFVKKEVVTKLMLWVKAWQDNNLVMLANINDFQFSPIVYNENNATMTTTENWSFSYVNIATKKMAHDNVDMLYKMRYTLEKHPHGWMIVEIKHLEETVTTKPHKPSLNKKDKPKDDKATTH